MKKTLMGFFTLFIILLVASGCTSGDTSSKEVEKIAKAEDSGGNIENKKSGSNVVEMGVEDFEGLLGQMPVSVISTDYLIQDDEYKVLYPDLLQAIIKNDTEHDIKDAVIAFVAWDDNNLPVKLKGNIDFSDGAYLREVNYSDINMIGGSTFGEGYGFALDQNINVSTFKAIPVSIKTFTGESWINPYYKQWESLYAGNRLTDSMTVNLVIDEENHIIIKSEKNDSNEKAMLEEELIGLLEIQDLKVVETKYIVQDKDYKILYPDLLQAIIKNDTEHDIKDAVIAFVAWDDNNLPVKLKGNIDFSDGTYIKLVNYNGINLVPGETYGYNSGYELDESLEIKSFRAIVVSYETFEGITWENPLFNDWKSIYEGKKIL